MAKISPIFPTSMYGAMEVKVKPEVLITQAEEVRRLGLDMKNRFRELENIIKRTNGYWIGEAGDLHRRLYMDKRDDVNKMLRRLLEHPDDLLKISGNYKEAERTNVETSKALPSDVIS